MTWSTEDSFVKMCVPLTMRQVEFAVGDVLEGTIWYHSSNTTGERYVNDFVLKGGGAIIPYRTSQLEWHQRHSLEDRLVWRRLSPIEVLALQAEE